MAIPVLVDQPGFSVQWNGGSLSPAPHNFAGLTEIMRLRLTNSLEVGDFIVVVVGRYRQQLEGSQIYDPSNTTFSTTVPTNGNKWLTAYISADEPSGAGSLTDFAMIHTCKITNRLVGSNDGGTDYIDLAWGNGGLGNNRRQGVATILRFSGKITAPTASVGTSTINTSSIALLSMGQQGAGQSDPVAHTVWNALNDLGGYNPFGYSNIYNRLEIVGVLATSYWSSSDQSAGITPTRPTSVTIDPSYSNDPSAVLTPFTALGPYDVIQDPTVFFPGSAPPARLWVFYRAVPKTELFNIAGTISPNANDWGATALGIIYTSGINSIDSKRDEENGRRYVAAINSSGNAVIYLDDTISTTNISALTSTIIDTATDCTFPNVHIYKDKSILYTYSKSGNIYFRKSTDLGKTWSAATMIAAGFTAHDLNSDLADFFPVIPAFRSSDSKLCIITGISDGAGGVTWNTPVSTGITISEVSPAIHVRNDGVFEITYVDTSNNIQIVRSNNLKPNGTGTWA